MQNLFLPTAQNGHHAHLLRTPSLVIIMIAIVVINSVSGLFPVSRVGAEINFLQLIELHNQERSKFNLPPLRLNAALSNSAQQKALVMLEKDCWSHYCPAGKSPWDFVVSANYEYIYAGENLAQGFLDSESAVVAWMNSPSHRENILRAEFEDIGFGIVQGSFQGIKDNIIIVVHFGTPQRNLTNTIGIADQGLATPEIITPRDGSYQAEKQVSISGKALEASQVTLIKDGEEWAKVPANEGVFTYLSPQLPEGTYKLNAISAVGTRKSAPSNPIEFSVDATPDSIQSNQLTVVTSATGEIMLQVNAPKLLQLELTVASNTIRFTPITDSIWEAKIADILKRPGKFTVFSRDLAGNTWQGELDSSVLAAQVNALPSTTQPSPTISRAGINWGIALVLGLLTLVDFIVLNRSGMSYKFSRKHLHLGVFVVIILVTLVGGAIGQIGTGISNL